MKTVLLVGMAVLLSAANGTANPRSPKSTPSSAQIDTPPSAAKLRLIRRYLQAIGLQHQLDTGSFLDHHAFPGGAMWPVSPGMPVHESVAGGFERRMAALKTAYAKHRSAYQEAYETHVNWEFTEAELAEIVAFLERPIGKHFLDGRWRMDAYVGTNTEELEEQIVKEAIAGLAK